MDSRYAAFFLPGMIGVMVSSDALFGVGPVMKEYFRQGVVREFRSYPLPLFWLFVTFIAVRLVFVAISGLLLILTSGVLFDFLPSMGDLALYVVGIALGYSAYSFIALTASFKGIYDNRDQGFKSTYYFLGMFLSGAFFDLSGQWPWADYISYAFPLRPMIDFMRGDICAFWFCLVWSAVTLTLFYQFTKTMKIKRA